MCGYLGNVVDSPLTQALMDILGEGLQQRLRHNTGSGPASQIDIIVDEGARQVRQATWWLLLEAAGDGFRPSRYTSFNTRSDKLDQPRSAGFLPYRNSRCIVPASYYIEGAGGKGDRVYHRIEPTRSAFALGGLYRSWLNPATGEVRYSCSVITLPPHPDPRWRAIHPKSMPLMLPQDREVLTRWLDPAWRQVEVFRPWLSPRLEQTLRCVPIERPGQQRQLGAPVMIEQDA